MGPLEGCQTRHLTAPRLGPAPLAATRRASSPELGRRHPGSSPSEPSRSSSRSKRAAPRGPCETLRGREGSARSGQPWTPRGPFLQARGARGARPATLLRGGVLCRVLPAATAKAADCCLRASARQSARPRASPRWPTAADGDVRSRGSRRGTSARPSLSSAPRPRPLPWSSPARAAQPRRSHAAAWPQPWSEERTTVAAPRCATFAPSRRAPAAAAAPVAHTVRAGTLPARRM